MRFLTACRFLLVIPVIGSVFLTLMVVIMGLGRIFHQPSAASTYLAPSQGLLLHGVLDVLSSTPAFAALREALDLTQATHSRDEV